MPRPMDIVRSKLKSLMRCIRPKEFTPARKAINLKLGPVPFVLTYGIGYDRDNLTITITQKVRCACPWCAVFCEGHGVKTPVELIRPEGMAIAIERLQRLAGQSRICRKMAVPRKLKDDKANGQNENQDDADGHEPFREPPSRGRRYWGRGTPF